MLVIGVFSEFFFAALLYRRELGFVLVWVLGYCSLRGCICFCMSWLDWPLGVCVPMGLSVF
jgi:hypothetical protein